MLLRGNVNRGRTDDLQTQRPSDLNGGLVIDHDELLSCFLGEDDRFGFADIKTAQFHQPSDTRSILDRSYGEPFLTGGTDRVRAWLAKTRTHDLTLNGVRDQEPPEELMQEIEISKRSKVNERRTI